MSRSLRALALLWVTPGLIAETPKSSTIIAITGIRTTERWHKSDRIRMSDGEWYVSFGALAVSPRIGNKPIRATVWGRGDIMFFDPSHLPNGTWPSAGSESSTQVIAQVIPEIINAMHSRRALHRVMHATTYPSGQPRYIGYLIQTPAGRLEKSTAGIAVAVEGLEPEQIPIALELAEDKSAGTWITILTTLFSTGFGAIIGLGSFYFQQRFQRQRDKEASFALRKVEKSQSLWRFFQEVYGPLSTDENRAEIERVNDVRDTMIQDGIYATLMPETAAKIAAICDRTKTRANAMADLDKVLREQFPEFMV